MLKLSRKEQEGITLILENGDHVKIELTEYRGQSTIVGISAPKEIKIWRDELLSEEA